MAAVFDSNGRVALIASTARGHRALRLERGNRSRRIRRARRFGRGLMVRRAGRGSTYVFGVRRGRITFVAVASRSAAKTRGRLRAHLREAGLR